jgi:hypothetical protein
MVFCTVCGGLDEGDDPTKEHAPKLRIVPLRSDAEDKIAFEALGVPYELQPVEWQTNGLAKSQ